MHPGLGRFLSADPLQPNAPGTQGFNLYAYVANNPTSWVDPSGFSGEPVNPIPAEDSFLAAANMLSLPAIGYYSGNLADWGDYMTAWLGCAFKLCFNLESDLMGLINQFGSAGANTYLWTIESLQEAFVTHPQQPKPVDPGALIFSMAFSNVPVWGDLYDLYTGITGYDPLTGEYLRGWERGLMILGAIPLPLLTGHNLRTSVKTGEFLFDHGDDIGIFLRSSNSLMGAERAIPELVEAVRRKGRIIEFATQGSEELRYLDYIGAEANVGGEMMTHILLREDPSKVALLEEFLHGTQHKLGIIERLGVSGAERHVKEFMIRHRHLLGLSDEDVRILQILKDAGL